MANYSGLVPVNISSFSAFANEIIDNAYDVDLLNGYQCVDLAKLLTGNAGRTSPYWKSGSSGYAREGWLDTTSREYNKGTLFTLVYNKEDVRTGDLVVLDETTTNPYGHIAFATTNWNSSTTTAPLLGQNQEHPSPTIGYKTTITNVNVSTFLGAFRFIDWQSRPTVNPTKTHFKWSIYARKLRDRRRV